MAWTTVIDDTLAGAATTSWATSTFTALEEGKIYKWSLRFVANAGTTATLFCNSDTTDSNYERQRRSNFNASAADNGLVAYFANRTTHTGFAVRWGGYVWLFSQAVGDNSSHRWYMDAVIYKTTDVITQFTVVADTANGVGIGTRFVLEELTATAAAEVEVTGAAATSMAFGGVSITNVSDPHLLVAFLQHTASATLSEMFFCGDTTAANYDTGDFQGVTASENNDAVQLDTDSDGAAIVVGFVMPNPSGNPVFMGFTGNEKIAGTPCGRFVTSRNTNEVAGFDEIQWTCGTSSGLAVGSNAKLFQLNT